MVIRGEIRKGAYFDSVTLMIVSGKLNELEGVEEASVVMATGENRSILEAAGLWTGELDDASETDLVISLRAASEEVARKALEQVGELLGQVSKKQSVHGGPVARSLEQAVEQLRGARLALISVAGRHAAAEARRALDAGLHVMLFSDNVSLEDERGLKELALSKGLFMMGPDCGTAIINGVPLAFANRVARGPVGVVAASGTGLQEVCCLLDRHGTGISQAIGTGGRDIKEAVGGIMFMEGIRALARDEDTTCIVLISKPPDLPVLKKVSQCVRDAGKPVVALFIGGDPGLLSDAGAWAASDLEEAALLAHTIVRGEAMEGAGELMLERQKKVRSLARQIRQKGGWTSATPREQDKAAQDVHGRSRKFLRALYSGGTLCHEAQWILRKMSVRAFSNTPLEGNARLEDPRKSKEHSLVDMGDDLFTSGRPHPMMDFRLRNERMLQEAADPETAILLFDLVLGYGAHPSPLDELLPLIGRLQREVPEVLLICPVTGTEGDPQDRNKVVRGLEQAGVVVMPSNASAALLAGQLIMTPTS